MNGLLANVVDWLVGLIPVLVMIIYVIAQLIAREQPRRPVAGPGRPVQPVRRAPGGPQRPDARAEGPRQAVPKPAAAPPPEEDVRDFLRRVAELRGEKPGTPAAAGTAAPRPRGPRAGRRAADQARAPAEAAEPAKESLRERHLRIRKLEEHGSRLSQEVEAKFHRPIGTLAHIEREELARREAVSRIRDLLADRSQLQQAVLISEILRRPEV